MKKAMYFFMGLSFVLFWVELYLVSTNQGHWGFVWINVFIFFAAVIVLAQSYTQGETIQSKRNKLKNMASKQKHVWGDSRKL